MSIPESHKKERLHSAYIRAVISHAEHSFTGKESDYGIDGIITRVQKIPLQGKDGKTKYSYIDGVDLFHYQLKATTKCERDENGNIKYIINARAYDRFVPHTASIVPAVLIVYDMPDDVHTCVLQDDKQLLMMGCCYWKFMDNKALETKVQYIPSNQIFNADAVNYILDYHKEEVGKLKELRDASSA